VTSISPISLSGYAYRVRACNQGICSGYTNTVVKPL
jgi:hypothetical protein